MISINELVSFLCLELLLLVLIMRMKERSLREVLLIQNIICVSFLLFSHVYAYSHYRTFPDISYDGLQYDFYAQNIALNLRSGVFSLRQMDISSAISVPYDLPYWTYARDIDSISPIHPLIGGILYLLFGHAPLVFKLFNVILFAVSTVYFSEYSSTTMQVRVILFFMRLTRFSSITQHLCSRKLRLSYWL